MEIGKPKTETLFRSTEASLDAKKGQVAKDEVCSSDGSRFSQDSEHMFNRFQSSASCVITCMSSSVVKDLHLKVIKYVT